MKNIVFVFLILFSVVGHASSWKIYQNKKYQFTLEYPSNLELSENFTRTYLVGNAWSSGSAIYDNNHQQHSIVQIQLKNISHQADNAYYYQSFVRVGASSDPKDIQNCENANNASLARPFQKYEMIDGQKFFVFKFSDAAMSQLNSGTSYRIKHHGLCYAIESIETAGNVAAMPNYSTISQKSQQLAKKIISTFKFID